MVAISFTGRKKSSLVLVPRSEIDLRGETQDIATMATAIAKTTNMLISAWRTVLLNRAIA